MSVVFNKTFKCTQVDPEGKQFDDVSRIYASSDEGDFDLVLDYNCFIYDIKVDQVFQLNIVLQLYSEESKNMEEHWHPSLVENSTIAAAYEYIMHGKVYNYEFKQDKDNRGHQNRAIVYISFGGLLMSLEGDANTISEIQRGKEVYILISKKGDASKFD